MSHTTCLVREPRGDFGVFLKLYGKHQRTLFPVTDALRIYHGDACGYSPLISDLPALLLQKADVLRSGPLMLKFHACEAEDGGPEPASGTSPVFHEVGADEKAVLSEDTADFGENFLRFRHDMQGVGDDDRIEGITRRGDSAPDLCLRVPSRLPATSGESFRIPSFVVFFLSNVYTCIEQFLPYGDLTFYAVQFYRFYLDFPALRAAGQFHPAEARGQ